jgi:hypothetical protein
MVAWTRDMLRCRGVCYRPVAGAQWQFLFVVSAETSNWWLRFAYHAPLRADCFSRVAFGRLFSPFLMIQLFLSDMFLLMEL